VFTALYGLNQYMCQIRFNMSPRGLGFNPRPVPVGVVADKVALVETFLPVLCFPCYYHSTNAPYPATCCTYQKDKRAKAGDLLKSNVLSEVGEHWTDKHIHLVVEGLIFIVLYL
jgi:hypothetical protein